MTLRTIFGLLLVLSNLPFSYGSDLTAAFKSTYKKELNLSKEEQKTLKDFNFYLIPGILSETFIRDDRRSYLDFSILTRDYFSAQEKFLQKKYGLQTKRLNSSSRSVEEIRLNIRKMLEISSSQNKKSFFITHSLGGLALLEELVLNPIYQDGVAGIIFIQSPFHGTPMADVYGNYPYQSDVWLKPILPFFNTSEETIRYLGTKSRGEFMATEEASIKALLKKIPVLSVGGVANDHKSLFKPAVDIMAYGCIKTVFSRCLSRVLYQGPYDESDGMVPFKSSRLLDADFVKVDRLDHGETVVNVPFENYKKEAFTVTLLKLILPKLNP